MRKLLLLAAVAALFIVALPVAAAGAASPFDEVTIEVETTLSGLGSSYGPFTSSGGAFDGVCETGWTFDAFGKQSPRNGNPNGSNFQIFKVFLCEAEDFAEQADSGFVLKLQVRDDKKGDNYSWVVAFAWGELDGLKGNGAGSGDYILDGDGNRIAVDDHLWGKVR